MRKKSILGMIVVLGLVAIMLSGYIKNQLDTSKTVNEQSQIKGYEVNLEKVETGIKKGQLAPDFTLQPLTGESLTLSDLKGKKVLLNFWASWCPPCKKEMPDLQDYYENYAKEENVEIVAVNLTHTEKSLTTIEAVEAVRLFVDSYDLTFPIPFNGRGFY
ncbi:Peroxiredoxin OS=Ureibacillus acetophenoni OX=614649 GN=SAMN05877842_101216 PE=4 SV=1 [Ureibacillus acetophenoni]